MISRILSLTLSRNIPSKIPSHPFFLFSNKKKLKNKINQEREEIEKKTDEPQKPSDPQFQTQTPAEKWGLKVLPPLIMGTFFNDPFSNEYLNLLLVHQKIAFLLAMLNIRYSPKSKIHNYATVIAAITANVVMPITNIESIGLQFFQILIMLSEENKKMDENVKLSERQKIILKLRLKMKLILLLAAISVVLFKLNYHYHCFKMEKQIEQLNSRNKMEASNGSDEKEAKKG